MQIKSYSNPRYEEARPGLLRLYQSFSSNSFKRRSISILENEIHSTWAGNAPSVSSQPRIEQFSGARIKAQVFIVSISARLCSNLSFRTNRKELSRARWRKRGWFRKREKFSFLFFFFLFFFR